MTSKPTEKPTWATDANYPAGPNPWNGTPTKVDPLVGLKAAGWDPKQKPPAQNLNWWMNNVGRWVDYLEPKAVVDYAMIAATDVLSLDPDGSGNLDDVSVVRVHPTGTLNAIRSMIDAEDGKTILIVNGFDQSPLVWAAFTIAHLDGAGTDKGFFLPGADYLSTPGDNIGAIRAIMLDPGASILVRKDDDLDAWRVIGMTGCRRATSMSISPKSALQRTGGSDVRQPYGGIDVQNGVWDYPIEIPVGSLVTGWRLYISKLSNALGVVSAELEWNIGTNTTIQTGTSVGDNSNATGFRTIEFLDELIGVFSGYNLWLSAQQSNNIQPDRLLTAEIFYWSRPGD